MIRRTLFLVIAVMLLPIFPSYADSDFSAGNAKAAALYVPESGQFLYLKNADTRLPMASTTKIMTALLAVESHRMDEIVTVTGESAGIEGTSLYLSVGDTATLRDFVYATLLSSANDAASAVAVALSGSVSDFAEAMNQKAAELKLDNTHFDNPHGLDSETHYTTARDLAVLAGYAMQKPEFRQIASTKDYAFTLHGTETKKYCHNHNRLLSSLSGTDGVKTGFTKLSGRCLVSSVTRNGITVVAVTLNCPDDWNTHNSLVETAFSLLSRRVLAKEGQISFSVPIFGSGTSVTVSNACELTTVLPENADVKIKTELLPLPVSPIKRGDTLGSVTFYYNGSKIAESPLTAEESVSLPQKKRFSLFSK